MSTITKLEAHLAETLEALGNIDLQDLAHVVKILALTRKQNSFVWLIGNGGSASTASHFANDLMKQCGIRAVALPDLTPLITAFGNDDAWSQMFSDALDGYARAGDVLIAFSCGGNSENVIRASARNYGEVIVFTGNNRDSKLIQESAANVIVYVESSDIMVQESMHLVVCHAIVAALKPLKLAGMDLILDESKSKDQIHWVKTTRDLEIGKCMIGKNSFHSGPLFSTPEGKTKCAGCGTEW